MSETTKSPVLLIAGGPSGGGKSTFVQIIRHLLYLIFKREVLVISTDHYYRDLSHLAPRARARVNFDSPDAMDFDLLLKHIQCMMRGEAFDRPTYDFKTHTRIGIERIDPKQSAVIVIEGILALHDDRIVTLAGKGTVYVDVPQIICFMRRLLRDRKMRGRSVWSITHQYLRTVLPGYRRYIEPSARKANIRVHSGGYNPLGILEAVRYIEEKLGHT